MVFCFAYILQDHVHSLQSDVCLRQITEDVSPQFLSLMITLMICLLLHLPQGSVCYIVITDISLFADQFEDTSSILS